MNDLFHSFNHYCRHRCLLISFHFIKQLRYNLFPFTLVILHFFLKFRDLLIIHSYYLRWLLLFDITELLSTSWIWMIIVWLNFIFDTILSNWSSLMMGLFRYGHLLQLWFFSNWTITLVRASPRSRHTHDVFLLDRFMDRALLIVVKWLLLPLFEFLAVTSTAHTLWYLNGNIFIDCATSLMRLNFFIIKLLGINLLFNIRVNSSIQLSTSSLRVVILLDFNRWLNWWSNLLNVSLNEDINQT